MTLFLIEKGLVLEGWPSKIEVDWVLGIIYFCTCIENYLFHVYINLEKKFEKFKDILICLYLKN